MNIAALNVKIGADIADFSVGLKSVTTTFDKLSSSLNSGFRSINSSVDKFGNNVKNEFKSINNSLERTSRKFNDVKDQFQGFSNVGEGLKDVGTTLTLGLTLPIVGLGAASVKTFGDIQALKRGLIAIMGTAEDAEKEFKKLIEVAKLPGLGLSEAVRGSVALQSAGFSPDQARETLLAFGNALATVGKGKNELDFVILALTQLQNKTSGFGQDLRQLTEQLPQLRGALKAAFGTASSEEIAALGFTGEEVVRKITTEFAKLPEVTGGINNAFENMSDSIQISLAKIGLAINETFDIEGKINRLSDIIRNLADSFAALPEKTKKVIYAIAGIATVIGPLLIGFGAILTAIPLMVAGWGTLVGVIGAVLPWIAAIAAVGALATAAYGVYQAWDTFEGAFATLWDKIRITAADAVLDILQTIDQFTGVFTTLTGFEINLTGPIEAVKAFGREAVKSLNIDYTSFEDANNAMRDSIIAGFGDMKEKVKDFFVGTSEAVTKTVEKVKEGVEGINNAVSRIKFPDLALLQGKGADVQFTVNKTAFEELTEVLERLINKLPDVAAGFKNVGEQAKITGQQIESALTGAIIGFAQSLGEILTNDDIPVFQKILGVVVDFVGQFGKMLIAAGVAALAFQNLLSNPIAAIVAGAALVAVAGVIKAHLSKGPAGGPAPPPLDPEKDISNNTANFVDRQSLDINIQGVVRGEDLAFILDKNNRKKGRVG